MINNQVQVYSFNDGGGERDLDFTECVHLNLSHCLSFGKPQNISCLHARGGGSLNAYYYLGVTGSRTHLFTENTEVSGLQQRSKAQGLYMRLRKDMWSEYTC